MRLPRVYRVYWPDGSWSLRVGRYYRNPVRRFPVLTPEPAGKRPLDSISTRIPVKVAPQQPPKLPDALELEVQEFMIAVSNWEHEQMRRNGSDDNAGA